MGTLGKDTNAYYRFHSRIYDLTRWAYLFGRSGMVEAIAAKSPRIVLEIGCGTGRNLIQLKRSCPETVCIGVDASGDMLDVARSKSKDLGIEWLQGTYPSEVTKKRMEELGAPDVVLFSYALSMFNPGWEECLEQAHRDVASDGVVSLVDFHDSQQNWFRRWMGCNHVRMEGQLQEKVENLGRVGQLERRKGLLGVWEWLHYMSQPQGKESLEPTPL